MGFHENQTQYAACAPQLDEHKAALTQSQHELQQIILNAKEDGGNIDVNRLAFAEMDVNDVTKQITEIAQDRRNGYLVKGQLAATLAARCILACTSWMCVNSTLSSS